MGSSDLFQNLGLTLRFRDSTLLGVGIEISIVYGLGMKGSRNSGFRV